jgi:hypothetical protein
VIEALWGYTLWAILAYLTSAGSMLRAVVLHCQSPLSNVVGRWRKPTVGVSRHSGESWSEHWQQ